MANPISAFPNVVDVLSLSGLQREFNFEIKLPDMGAIPGLMVGIYCESVSFGQYNMSDVTKIRYGAFRKGYAGFLDIEDVRMTFLQPYPDVVSAYFSKWRKLIVSDKGFYSHKSQYAKDIYVVEFDRTSLPGGIFKLSGCFPKTFPAHSLSNTSDAVARFQIAFHVDKVVDLMETGVMTALGI